MKKLIYITLLLFTIIGCETKSDIQSDIQKLKTERAEINKSIEKLKSFEFEKKRSLLKLNEKLKVLKIYESGKTPQYILKIQLKQSHFSLDIGKHLKDAMNKIEFEIPTSKEFYNSVDVGTEIVDEFRSGSFILHGSIGKWKMKIIKKYIK